jgi:hypothetical protein
MSTASITHRPIPMAAAGAAVVAVLGFVGLTMVQNDTGSTSPPPPSSQGQQVNPDAHYQRPMHSGMQVGQP